MEAPSSSQYNLRPRGSGNRLLLLDEEIDGSTDEYALQGPEEDSEEDSEESKEESDLDVEYE